MSIAALLQAAEYIERRDREAEHGYASTMPIPDDIRSVTKRPKTKKSQGSRTTHNELEKNRYVQFTKEVYVSFYFSFFNKRFTLQYS
uniref:Max dimerization protein 1-like n=1 Tax=Trichogramma kaykai TaxID=54128 RepID=A0ABD2WEZ3_9HYME